MPCFKHNNNDVLARVAHNTLVYLEKKPEDDISLAVVFLWRPSDPDCGGHNQPIDDADLERLSADLKFTHTAQLVEAIIGGFRCHQICRLRDDDREILYRFRAAGAQLKNIQESDTPICDA